MRNLDKLREVNARLDPLYDTVLGRIAASRYSALWVIGYGVACFVAGALAF